MLKERVRAFLDAGANCSRTILLAAAEEYDLSVSKDVLAVCGGISGGFGIGSMCSALVASVMVLGLLFDEGVIEQKRILFLLMVQENLGALDCFRLSASGEDCSDVMEGIAEILQEVIEG